jgi:hypothetical protein
MAVSITGMIMKRDAFEEMINGTSFDAATKALFMTSYDLGFMFGKIDQMHHVNEQLDLIVAERQMEFETKQ